MSYWFVKITPKLRGLKQQTFTISQFLRYKSESSWGGWFWARVSQEIIVKISVEAAPSESLTGVEGSVAKMAHSHDYRQGNFRSSLDIGRSLSFLTWGPLHGAAWVSTDMAGREMRKRERERSHNVFYDLFLEVPNHHDSIDQKCRSKSSPYPRAQEFRSISWRDKYQNHLFQMTNTKGQVINLSVLQCFYPLKWVIINILHGNFVGLSETIHTKSLDGAWPTE